VHRISKLNKFKRVISLQKELNKWVLQPESNCDVYKNPPEIFPEETEDFILLSCGRAYNPAGNVKQQLKSEAA
jgi:hypothetical protein